MDEMRAEGSRPAKEEDKQEEARQRWAKWAHLAPYLLWILFIAGWQVALAFVQRVQLIWIPAGYAVKSLLCAILLIYFKPWRYYQGQGSCVLRCCPMVKRCGGYCLGILVGLAVAFLWIFPESEWFFRHAQAASEFYHKWFIVPFGEFPSYFHPGLFPEMSQTTLSCTMAQSYSPEIAGWGLTIAKVIGSAFVIAVAEEYFFRGFLYRWLRNSNFTSIPLTVFDKGPFWIVVALFAVEHDRLVMGAVAGILYGLLAVRSGNLRSAIVAHITTNLVLGIYVVVNNRYCFW